MKLNTECIRAVLLKIEEFQQIFLNNDGIIEKETIWIEMLYEAMPEYDKADVFYSVDNLEQAGYLNVSVNWVNGCVAECAINFMTYDGHEFLESIRDTKQWGIVKKGLCAVRNYSLSAISSIAEGATSAAISTYLAQIS